MLMKRDEGGAFDDLAMGLDSGAITRGKAIKLAGAALLSGALGVFAAAAPAAADVGVAAEGCGRGFETCRRRPGGKAFCCPRNRVDRLGCRRAIQRGFCFEK